MMQRALATAGAPEGAPHELIQQRGKDWAIVLVTERSGADVGCALLEAKGDAGSTPLYVFVRSPTGRIRKDRLIRQAADALRIQPA
jgi:hypothetical protein